jgi:hypothetical protein
MHTIVLICLSIDDRARETFKEEGRTYQWTLLVNTPVI